jgi:hypothetical protein
MIPEAVKERNGTTSSMRIMFMIGIIWGMSITTFLIIKGASTMDAVAFFSSVTGVFLTGKLIQKPMEAKSDENSKQKSSS